jgi:hypothetical protein
MCLPNAPSAALLSFSPLTRIAVEKDSVLLDNIHLVDGLPFAPISGGRDDECFRIIPSPSNSTNDDSIIIESPSGFLIRGDFTHAGISAITHSPPVLSAFQRLQRIILPLRYNPSLNRRSNYPSIFQQLCDIQSLDTIARLHVFIAPRDHYFLKSETAVPLPTPSKRHTQDEHDDDNQDDDHDEDENDNRSSQHQHDDKRDVNQQEDEDDMVEDSHDGGQHDNNDEQEDNDEQHPQGQQEHDSNKDLFQSDSD